MITIARQIGVGFSNLLELEIFLATQALLGIGWGSPSAASSIWRKTCTIIASVWKLNWRRVAR
ncbi:Sensor histidine protein kinase UhpB, glucose-6-phosphate specific [Citrobacter freundii]|uniref:Sensor histidine protein kinase UhpB, glucose-6-phosphate specific n=1 Tax=Citrobacter freundii TaxID=546 RepID=A0A7G2IZJ4_CITFR|nr:Sensor histidine protein kinase UhpB, glucose-6-phosphate specific [Citrobacter freundii]